MLVLTRRAKPDKDTIFIEVHGIVIEIKVVEFRGEACRLGFTAPKDVVIRRGELSSKQEQ